MPKNVGNSHNYNFLESETSFSMSCVRYLWWEFWLHHEILTWLARCLYFLCPLSIWPMGLHLLIHVQTCFLLCKVTVSWLQFISIWWVMVVSIFMKHLHKFMVRRLTFDFCITFLPQNLLSHIHHILLTLYIHSCTKIFNPCTRTVLQPSTWY